MLRVLRHRLQRLRNSPSAQPEKWVKLAGLPSLSSLKSIRSSPLRPLSEAGERLRRFAKEVLGQWRPNFKDERDLKRLDGLVSEAKSMQQHHSSVWTAGDRMMSTELYNTVWAFQRAYCKNFRLHPTASVAEVIQPSHLLVLYDALNQAFATGTPQQRQLLASVLDPLWLKAVGMKLDTEESQAAEQGFAKHGVRLSCSETLALLSYLQPMSYSYQVVNGGARLQTFWGIEGIAHKSSRFSLAYLTALQKLSRIEGFIDHQGSYYKGIFAQQAFGPNGDLLQHLLSNQGWVLPPHPISATRLARESFATKSWRPQDTDIQLLAASAIDVSPFHGAQGKALAEVIFLPTPWRVIARETLQLSEKTVSRYVLRADPEASERSLRLGRRIFKP